MLRSNGLLSPHAPSRLQGILSGCLIAGAALAASEEIIYDNTDSIYQLGTYYPKILEYGDEVVLAGDARTMTRFQFDYFGEFIATGQETATVRFYANDATPEVEGVYSSAPGTLLYESGAMRIAGGYNTLSLNNLHVPVPNHFTWTVQFGGLTGLYKNRAGLLFTTKPVVGSSFNDIWQRDVSGWNTYVWNSMDANYTARIFALSETPLTIESIKRHGAENRLTLYGPAFASVALESTADFVNWRQLDELTLLGKPVEVYDALAPGEFLRFYRLRRLDEPIIKTTEWTLNENNGSMLIKLQGVPGRGVTIQGTTNMTEWVHVGTDYFTSLHAQYVDYTAVTNNFVSYRALPATNDSVLAISSTLIAPEKRVVLMAGPPGRDCVVETSGDLRSWTPAGTNTFSFYSGELRYFDMQASGTRFFRTRILPLLD